jgi:exonuclease SbcD
MAGLDHEFTTSALFSAQASAFMLGHIHKHQVWREQGRVAAYAGSVGRLHYGEEDAKGFLVWEVGAASAEFEFVPTPARRMVHFDFQGPPDIDVLKAAAHHIAGAFVRVRWSVPEEDHEAVDAAAIEAAVQGAAEVKLVGRIVPVVRSRAQGISQAHTLAEKVRRWAVVTGVEAAGVLERLARIEECELDQILEKIRGNTEVGQASEAIDTVFGCAQAQNGSRAACTRAACSGPGSLESTPTA